MVSDYINILTKVIEANRDVDLSGDIFFINKVPFFATISNNIKFTTTELLASRKIKNVINAAQHVKTLYHARGFKV